jgi:hypothetical protein
MKISKTSELLSQLRDFVMATVEKMSFSAVWNISQEVMVSLQAMMLCSCTHTHTHT